jgi:hypothetical protein
MYVLNNSKKAVIASYLFFFGMFLLCNDINKEHN